jgi:hypothetical protein
MELGAQQQRGNLRAGLVTLDDYLGGGRAEAERITVDRGRDAQHR